MKCIAFITQALKVKLEKVFLGGSLALKRNVARNTYKGPMDKAKEE